MIVFHNYHNYNLIFLNMKFHFTCYKLMDKLLNSYLDNFFNKNFIIAIGDTRYIIMSNSYSQQATMSHENSKTSTHNYTRTYQFDIRNVLLLTKSIRRTQGRINHLHTKTRILRYEQICISTNRTLNSIEQYTKWTFYATIEEVNILNREQR